ncbi:MAG TPA: leucine--tRNA ligase [Anaerolineaceae bacterium]|nr:leucine--tRNA ligase [Anaerolineaceae bacterium]
MDPIYQAVDFSEKEKAYVLVEFPYPSGAGLHIGHAFSFVGGDIFARFLRMQGKNVLFPIGWDAFGLPTENYAIRTGRKPQDVTRENTAVFHRQMDHLGLSFDWAREVNTSDPSFYQWTQWIFIKLFEKGLTHKQEMPINWCPRDKVGLANEEVINGRCERCGTPVVRRLINQWVVNITAYADRLIEGLNHTEFIDKVKAAQINWIGKSEGARIRFRLAGREETLEVFTTRPDTLWGATFLVLSPEHPLASTLRDNPEVARYVKLAAQKSDLERSELNREKDGVFSGLMAIHPATGAEIPLWISDFVLMGYGSGAIMAVPAHDERDHAFARTFGLPIVPVIRPPFEWDFELAAYTGDEGEMINSGPLDGLPAEKAIPAAIQWLEDRGLGEKAASYHLRDWIFSRQHYWGEPIPMVFCEQHGWVPVPVSQLPVLLPEVERYLPTDTGESPLANITEWVQTTCPVCSGPAVRETDTMPNWAGSDWYFLRYTDPHNDQALASMERLGYWMPVDVYIGGDEHNTLHLLYSRFIYLFLHDIGCVPPEIPEPYRKRLSHGVILGADGQRMSKSRGNVVAPDELVSRYGADVVRAYLMFMGPFDATMAWNERALLGVKRYLDRLAAFVRENASLSSGTDAHTRAIVDRLVKAVGDDIFAFKFNTAVARQMEALNELTRETYEIGQEALRKLVQVVAPFAPFLAEECWKILQGEGSVHASRWPEYDPPLIAGQTVTVSVQVNGKLRGLVEVEPGADEETVTARAKEIEPVQRALAGGSLRKVIYVKDRTLNFVVG